MGKRKTFFGSFLGQFICADADGQAFINAHEVATGLTMADTQRNAICGLVTRLKGTGTTNSTDIWTAAKSGGALIHPLCPIDDSTANAAAYQMDLLSATSKGTYNNFVGGDFTANGVIGGTTKYFDLGVGPSNYNASDVSHYAYNRTVPTDAGDAFGVQQSLSVPYYRTGLPLQIADDIYIAVNSASFKQDLTTNTTGFTGVQRSSTTHMNVVKNGVIVTTIANTQINRANINMYAHARNRAGAAVAEGNAQLCTYITGLQSLTTNGLVDLNEAIQWYQTNVITGGRNV